MQWFTGCMQSERLVHLKVVFTLLFAFAF